MPASTAICTACGRPRLKRIKPKALRRRIEESSMKYVCDVCGYIYDPAVGDPDAKIPAGTTFEALPEDWVCPMCGAGKDSFSPA